MLIKYFGGEFALIDHIKKMIPIEGQDIVVGIGDDAAVLHDDDENYLLFTTDTMVANDHFNTQWSMPWQIGVKAVESNVSDIAAMGGYPTYMMISLVLTPTTHVEWVEGLYKGIAIGCKEYNIPVIGGNITHGPAETITITLIGKVAKNNLRLRSHGQDGDFLVVTGSLGASNAALRLLRKQLPVSEYLLTKHLTPTCRLDAAQKLAPIANAMIDISDGLASETNHICEASHLGAVIRESSIPLHPDVIEAGNRLGISPYECALNGGDDYELLFSISKNKIDGLDDMGLSYFIVGELTSVHKNALISTTNGDVPLKGGYNHFTNA